MWKLHKEKNTIQRDCIFFEEKHDSVESEPVEDKKSEEKSESEISAPVEKEREQEAPKLDVPQAEDNQVSRAISEFQNVVKRFKFNRSVSLKDLISYNIKTILPGLKLTNKEVSSAIGKHDLGQYFEYTMRMLNDKNHAKERSQLNENLEKIFNYLIERNENKKLELERLAQIEAQRVQEKAKAQAPVEEQKAEEKSESEISAPAEEQQTEVPQTKDEKIKNAVAMFKNILKESKHNRNTPLRELMKEHIKKLIPGLNPTLAQIDAAIRNHNLDQYFGETINFFNDKKFSKQRAKLDEYLGMIFNYLIEQNEKK